STSWRACGSGELGADLHREVRRQTERERGHDCLTQRRLAAQGTRDRERREHRDTGQEGERAKRDVGASKERIEFALRRSTEPSAMQQEDEQTDDRLCHTVGRGWHAERRRHECRSGAEHEETQPAEYRQADVRAEEKGGRQIEPHRALASGRSRLPSPWRWW